MVPIDSLFRCLLWRILSRFRPRPSDDHPVCACWADTHLARDRPPFFPSGFNEKREGEPSTSQSILFFFSFISFAGPFLCSLGQYHDIWRWNKYTHWPCRARTLGSTYKVKNKSTRCTWRERRRKKNLFSAAPQHNSFCSSPLDSFDFSPPFKVLGQKRKGRRRRRRRFSTTFDSPGTSRSSSQVQKEFSKRQILTLRSVDPIVYSTQEYSGREKLEMTFLLGSKKGTEIFWWRRHFSTDASTENKRRHSNPEKATHNNIWNKNNLATWKRLPTNLSDNTQTFRRHKYLVWRSRLQEKEKKKPIGNEDITKEDDLRI